MNAQQLSANFATDYLLYWKVHSLSCPEHFKQSEIDRRMAAWVEMSVWWRRLNETTPTEDMQVL